MVARVLGLPVVGSYHTELAAYTGLRSGRAELEALVGLGLGGFYGSCDIVLSPSEATDERLEQLGVARHRIARWDRGVDLARFDPARARSDATLPGELNVLYAGRLTHEKGIDLLADAFLAARSREPRLHLVLAGGGPEEARLRERLGESATFLGWLAGDELSRVYAAADAFLFASQTDTFGQVILEAQASGLPVVAVNRGGPASLIVPGETGLLTPAEPEALAEALIAVLNVPLLRERHPAGRARGGSPAQLGSGARSPRRRLPARPGSPKRAGADGRVSSGDRPRQSDAVAVAVAAVAVPAVSVTARCRIRNRRRG